MTSSQTRAVLTLLLLAAGCANGPVAPTPAVETVTTPSSTSRVIFVSSAAFNGALGGTDGADRACGTLASTAGLTGVFRAWISDADRSPATSFTRGPRPLVMTTGVEVAGNWTDLTDGSINNPIVVDERGTQPTTVQVVWTGTDADGRMAGSDPHCAAWSDSSGGGRGQTGAVGAIGADWTASASAPCHQPARLYCVEQ